MSIKENETPKEFYMCNRCDTKFSLYSNKSPNYCPTCGKSSGE